MVPHNTVIAPTIEKNVIKVATKKHKDKLYFKREGINDANVIEGKRNRTKNLILSQKNKVFNQVMTIILLYIIVQNLI